MIEIGQLRCLIAVVEERDHAAAARRLRMPQAALTGALDELEHEIGVPLLTRTDDANALTAAGRTFVAEARGVLARLDAAVADARGAADPGPALRIGCVPDLRLQRLQAFLGALYAQLPVTEVDVAHLPTVEQVRRLHARELELALIHGAPGDGGIEAEPLAPGELLAAFLPLGHRLAGRTTLGPEDLEGEVLIVSARAADPPLHDSVMALAEGDGYRFRAVREHRGADLRDILFAVAEGRGIAFAPRSAARVVGELGDVLHRCAVAPTQRMPDTVVAWHKRAAGLPGDVVSVARAVARAARAATEAGG